MSEENKSLKPKRKTMNNQIKISQKLVKQEKGFASYKPNKKTDESKTPRLGFTPMRLLDLKMFLVLLAKIGYKEEPKNGLIEIRLPLGEFIEVYDLKKIYRPVQINTEIPNVIEGLRSLGLNYYQGAKFVSMNLFARVEFENDLIMAYMIHDNIKMFDGSTPYKAFNFDFIKDVRTMREFNFYIWLKKYEQANYVYPDDIIISMSEFKREMDLKENPNAKEFKEITTSTEKKDFMRNFFSLNCKPGKDGFLTKSKSKKTSIFDFINSTDLRVCVSLTSKGLLHFHISSIYQDKLKKPKGAKSLMANIVRPTESTQTEPALRPANSYYIKFVGMNLEEFFKAVRRDHQEFEPFVANQLPLIEKDGFGFVNGIFTILAGFKIMG